jgi:8-amino-7-oxononanoate synthase
MVDVFDHLIDHRLGDLNPSVRRVLEEGCLYDRVADRIDGRRILVEGRWLDDFASCNYLGLDLRREVIEAVLPLLDAWGTHPSWARMACNVAPYSWLEERLARLLGTESCIVLPAISLIAIGLIPAIAGKESVIFADRFAHKVNFDGCRLAREAGAELKTFVHSDLGGLERELERARATPTKLIVIDGVLSVTGRVANVAAIVELARRHDAIVYIDDAHGFGIVGENPSPEHPYGRRGNGVVRHLGIGYDNVLYVAGLSKAYSSPAAFVACPKKLEKHLKCNVTSYLVSGPVSVASLATALAGLELNEHEGDMWRSKLYRHTARIIAAYRERGIATDNDTSFPIVSAYVGSTDNVVRGGQLMFESGVYVTLQPHPLVPRDRGVLRATPTVANTDEQVDRLIDATVRTIETLKREGRRVPSDHDTQ